LSVKADNARVATLEKKLDDLENRSKRNNIVIWNKPEGAEKDTSCQEIVSNILSVHMQLEGYLQIMRAHRTNIRRQKNTSQAASSLPRPVHVYLLRYTDKQYILRKAALASKDNLFQEALEKKWTLLTYPGMSQRVSSTKQKIQTTIEVVLPARGLNVLCSFLLFLLLFLSC